MQTRTRAVRLLALAAVLAMVVCCLPLQAFAAGEDTRPVTLNIYDIVNGKQGEERTIAVAADAADKDTLMAVKNAEGRTVEEMVTEKSGQTGEKVEMAYYARIEAPYCHSYVHFNKKLGTILGFNKVVPEEVAHAVAMQATAMAPIAIDVADCPADVVAHERQIAIEAMKQDPKNAGKPEAILEKIAEGKMRKFFEENTLLNQELVGEKKTIAQYIHEADKEATVVAYKRFALES